MSFHRVARTFLMVGSLAVLAACNGGLFGGGTPEGRSAAQEEQALLNAANNPTNNYLRRTDNTSTIWDLFQNNDNPNTTVEVNKYLWNAALDILNFLPVESVDPFTGVIVMGYGTPPGGGRSYRATVYVQDPALDARSIKVALQARGGGAVPVETQRAIEDAIMTRARQLRIQDAKL